MTRRALALGAAAVLAASACHHATNPPSPEGGNFPGQWPGAPARPGAPRQDTTTPVPAPPPSPSPLPAIPAVPVRLAPIAPLPNEPYIRIGIVVDRDSAIVGATGSFRFTDQAGTTLAVVDSGQSAVIRAGDGARRLFLFRYHVANPLALDGPVRLTQDDASGFVTVQGRRYRGDLVIQRGTAGVTVVNRAYLESYLFGVVSLELGFRSPGDREAVKAQAVAARTFAQRFRGRREALGFDVFPTDADQVYGGVESELPEVTEAVQATAGEILTYEGQPIQALFHSTCGWSTEAADQVFQNREPVPYLRAVSDRYGEGDRDFYCAISPKFRWREEWDADALTSILSRTLPGILGAQTTIGRVTDIRASRTTPTGRVAELIVTTTNGEYRVGNGRIRDVLRPATDRQLLSAMFQLHVEKDDNGRLTKVTASGAGYGHGVGMCQFGAVGRARAGADYRSILATYYHGTQLERIY